MRRISFTAQAVLTTTLVLLVTAAPVGARAAARPNERAAAEAFADAALVFTREARGQRREVERRLGAVDFPTCIRAVERGAQLGPARSNRLDELLFSAMFSPVLGPLVDPVDRFVAALEAIPTQDPRLRSARAGWRVAAWQFRMLSRAPEDVCARLKQWRVRGSRGLPLSGVDLRGFTAAFEAFGSFDDKLGDGAERLRELGQGPRRAARLTGDSALEPAVRLLDETEFVD